MIEISDSANEREFIRNVVNYQLRKVRIKLRRPSKVLENLVC